MVIPAADLSELVCRRSTDLAVALVANGVRFVVVGGTSRWLRGSSARPRDLDIAVVPAEVPRLAGVLASLGTHVRARTMLLGRTVSLATGWGPLDVFVVEVSPPAGRIVVGSVPLAVACV
jgi:hypothetical protein